jgi:hypothetical protein
MATYYWRSTGTNWNLTSSWSSTASPTYTNVTTVPTITDAAIFESVSANCTITNVAAAADTIDFTRGGTSNYAGLFTVGTTSAGTLTISRSLALSPAMSNVTGAAAISLQPNTTCSITSSGKSIHAIFNSLNFANVTFNLADTLTITDSIVTTYTNGGPTVTFNGGDVVIRKLGTLIVNTRGTSTIYLSPLTGQTASLYNAGGAFTMTNNLIISGSGRVDFNNVLAYTTGKITYVTASGVTFSNTLFPGTAHTLIASSCTLDTGGMTWDTYSSAIASNILILSSSLNVSRSFNHNNGNFTATPSGSARVNIYGNLNLNGSLVNIPLTITGSDSGRIISNLVTLNSNTLELKLTGGSISFPTSITVGGTQTIVNNSTGGTVIASGSTINLAAGAAPTFNTNTVLWGAFNSVVTGHTVILSSSLLLSGSLTFGSTGNLTFTGSAGWTCANLLCSTPGRTLTLNNSSSGASYTTTATASLLGSNISRITMTSDNATTQAIWTLDNGAQQSLTYVNGTRIDSSQGATVWSFGGTLTTASNWGSGSAPATTTYTYVC